MADINLATEIADILAKRHGFKSGLVGVVPDQLLVMLWGDANAIVKHLENAGYLMESDNG